MSESSQAVPISAPLPESELARCLDARRRAGLGDPDWSLSTSERVQKMALLGAIQTALDDETVGADKHGKRSSAAKGKMRLLNQAQLVPSDRGRLTAARNELARDLYGDPPPARPADLLSLLDPRTGQATYQRIIIPVALFISTGIVPFIAHASAAVLAIVLLLIALATGCSTYITRGNRMRLSAEVLMPGRGSVVTIDPTAASYTLARAVDRDTTAIVAESRSVDDIADLLTDRDRIIVELSDADARAARLDAVEADIDQSDAQAHARLTEEVMQWRRRLRIEADEIAAHARAAREAIEAAEKDRRAATVRAELDELAMPPATMLQSLKQKPVEGPDGSIEG